MDNVEIKNELNKGVEGLEENISRLKKDNKPTELISLFDRARNLVNIAILNFRNATSEDIRRISEVLCLCNVTAKPENLKLLSVNSERLYTTVESLEESFRNKRFLLEETIESTSLNF